MIDWKIKWEDGREEVKNTLRKEKEYKEWMNAEHKGMKEWEVENEKNRSILLKKKCIIEEFQRNIWQGGDRRTTVYGEWWKYRDTRVYRTCREKLCEVEYRVKKKVDW